MEHVDTKSLDTKQLDAKLLDVIEMKMTALNKMKTVRIWKPKTYQEQSNKKYPVIYMHDGQNLFELETAKHGAIWDVHTTVESLMTMKDFEGAIVVGIDYAPGLERLDELSPWVTERIEDMKASGYFQRAVGGEGFGYADFIVNQLKPYIDSHYRTLADREHTLVAGSSMGGLMSLYLGAAYPDVFGKICAMSTAAWFADQALTEQLKKIDLSQKTMWYLDIGTQETSSEQVDNFNQIYLEGTYAIEKLLLSQGVPSTDIKMIVETGGTHFETAWARRLPAALEWLFQLK